MAFVLAENAKLYYNTGTYASPTWAEICNVKDLTLSLEKDEVDVTTRCSGGFKEYADGLLDANVTFNMLYDPSDAAFTALQTAFFAKTAVEVLVLDGPETPASGDTSQGLRSTTMVKSFSRSESLGEALMTDVALRPVANDNAAPEWYSVSTP
jgi:hypothetical protein